jgi:hypothetical protein
MRPSPRNGASSRFRLWDIWCLLFLNFCLVVAPLLSNSLFKTSQVGSQVNFEWHVDVAWRFRIGQPVTLVTCPDAFIKHVKTKNTFLSVRRLNHLPNPHHPAWQSACINQPMPFIARISIRQLSEVTHGGITAKHVVILGILAGVDHRAVGGLRVHI